MTLESPQSEVWSLESVPRPPGTGGGGPRYYHITIYSQPSLIQTEATRDFFLRSLETIRQCPRVLLNAVFVSRPQSWLWFSCFWIWPQPGPQRSPWPGLQGGAGDHHPSLIFPRSAGWNYTKVVEVVDACLLICVTLVLWTRRSILDTGDMWWLGDIQG